MYKVETKTREYCETTASMIPGDLAWVTVNGEKHLVLKLSEVYTVSLTSPGTLWTYSCMPVSSKLKEGTIVTLTVTK